MAQYEDCIVFLLAKAYQKAHSAFKQKLAPFGITPVQQLILMVLGGEEIFSPAEISEKIAADSATLCCVLDRMAENLDQNESKTRGRSLRNKRPKAVHQLGCLGWACPPLCQG